MITCGDGTPYRTYACAGQSAPFDPQQSSAYYGSKGQSAGGAFLYEMNVSTSSSVRSEVFIEHAVFDSNWCQNTGGAVVVRSASAVKGASAVNFIVKHVMFHRNRAYSMIIGMDQVGPRPRLCHWLCARNPS